MKTDNYTKLYEFAKSHNGEEIIQYMRKECERMLFKGKMNSSNIKLAQCIAIESAYHGFYPMLREHEERTSPYYEQCLIALDSIHKNVKSLKDSILLDLSRTSFYCNYLIKMSEELKATASFILTDEYADEIANIARFILDLYTIKGKRGKNDAITVRKRYYNDKTTE